jgi:hypothetical protein
VNEREINNMHKRISKPSLRKSELAPRQPLAEGPRDRKRPRGFLDNMSDIELAGYTEWVMSMLGISTKTELWEADAYLYQTVLRRKLAGEVEFQGVRKARRNWVQMNNEELVAFAKKYIQEKGIRSKGELNRADGGLGDVLRRRNLLDRIEFEKGYRRWSCMTDFEFVTYMEAYKHENGISTRGQLQKADQSLYITLYRRDLLDSVFPL